MSSSKPTRLVLRLYKVGFGDCILLSFVYPKEQRHVLIDFGTSALPLNGGAGNKGLMARIAADIRAVCEQGDRGEEPGSAGSTPKSKLLAVVASHRHTDHVSGFDPGDSGKGTGAVIASCKPSLVIQPWTEDPAAPTASKGPPGLVARRRTYLSVLRDIHSLAATVGEELRRDPLRYGERFAGQLGFLGETNLKNDGAVRNLMGMAKNRYVRYGSASGLQTLLPGVKTWVLGPPTLAQAPGVSEERDEDPNEYWHLQVGAMRFELGSAPAPFARFATYRDSPPHTRWFLRRLESVRRRELLQLVRLLDEVLNNTSVILLLEVGKHRLLFPGDAQLENWSHALFQAPDRNELRELLRGVTIYKVGHHGSLNGTPKTLWGLMTGAGRAAGGEPLQTLLSTRKGKHGKVENGTEVPRRPLVSALEAKSNLWSTEDLKGANELCHRIELKL
ncbi:MAG: hypothetical protein HYZ53_14010 [Planctomycetes bacterium]|nr:hypothetical protein [Planctomycetota bacterium]